MARRGLNLEEILTAAIRMIEEKGLAHFSMHELADRLGIKTASLYNHLNGLREINLKLGMVAVERLHTAMFAAVEGKKKEVALRAAAKAYMDFAHQNPELYKAIICLPSLHDDKLDESGQEIIGLIFRLLNDYDMDTTDKIHYVRGLRSALHGFISLEEAGFFNQSIDVYESFDRMIECFIGQLCPGEKNREAHHA